MKTQFGGKKAAEIGFPGWNWRHEGKNLPWGAVKAEGMAVIFNTLLGEAMTNTVHHAYLDIRQDGLFYQPAGGNWWMFSQARDGMLSVVFCDLGVGIPNTLPLKKKSLFNKIVALGLSGSDAACIEQAVEDTRSRTNMSGRGHGLGNIVNVVCQHSKGNVTILSNRGCYSLRDGKPARYDFKESIMGTLISWRIPLLGA